MIYFSNIFRLKKKRFHNKKALQDLHGHKFKDVTKRPRDKDDVDVSTHHIRSGEFREDGRDGASSCVSFFTNAGVQHQSTRKGQTSFQHLHLHEYDKQTQIWINTRPRRSFTSTQTLSDCEGRKSTNHKNAELVDAKLILICRSFRQVLLRYTKQRISNALTVFSSHWLSTDRQRLSVLTPLSVFCLIYRLCGCVLIHLRRFRKVFILRILDRLLTH